MILAPVRATSLFETEGNRLDARYFSSPAIRIRSVLATRDDVELRRVGGPGGLAKVAAPSRFKRTYAAPGEDYVSYLRPYDVFEFLPPEADRLSVSRTAKLDEYRIKAGDLLQTCSGRNLGPLTIADDYLARFALSHDMIRVTIDDEVDRFYTLAFLQSPTGQHLLRGDLSGSVIDHITVDQVSAINVPFIASVRDEVAELMKDATQLRAEARVRLHDITDQFAAALPDVAPAERLANGWTHRAAQLFGRFDAAFHNPAVADLRDALRQAGGPTVEDVADTFIPGRYRRYYVEAGYGCPIVSGRQLLQSQPVNLRHIAARSFDFSVYELEKGMVAFGAEGRAEERIAQPALITGDRAGWLANNHVMRVRPRPGVNPGWLYLAFAVPQVQAQVKACSCGSVVDAVNPSDLNRVILPPVDDAPGAEAMDCWRDFAAASEAEAKAIETVEIAVQERIAALG
jgi:hypothetical protein